MDAFAPLQAAVVSARAGNRDAAARPATGLCRAVERLVGARTGIPVAELAAATRRSASAALARHTAMYLARVVHGLSVRDIAFAFGRDPRTVVQACRRIEERRDDPRFDAFVARLEDASAVLATAGGGR